MSIRYEVVKNSLTTPPSYFARPQPRVILGIDDMAAEINKRVPNIPFETAKSAIVTFQEIVGDELAGGNGVKIDSFCSWVVTMPGSMAEPTDPLPTGAFDIKAKPSAPFKTAVLNAATFERVGYASKEPSIVSAIDTNTSIPNYVREGFGFKITGAQMGWDQTDTNQGAFLLSSAGNNIRQTNISLSNPSNAFIVPVLDAVAGPAGANSVEQILSIVTRYTENGEYRTGTYKTPLRTTNVVAAATPNLFVVGSAAAGPATVTLYAGLQTDCRILAVIGGDNILRLSIGTLAGVFGDTVAVTAAGDYIVGGLASDVTINVNDFDQLRANVIAYGKYLQEVCDLSPIP